MTARPQIEHELRRRRTASHLPRWRVGLVCAALALLGCRAETPSLNTTYGQRRGAGANSVNGTGALAELFEASGYQITSRGQRAARLDDAAVIVWAPDNFAPPTQDERAEIETWLAARPGRTFVYIGRDYDAAVDYWRLTAQRVAPQSAAEAARQLALSRSTHDAARAAMPATYDAKWFQLERDHPRVRAARLDGPWAASIQGQRADIHLHARFHIPKNREMEGETGEADNVQKDREYKHRVLLGAGAADAVADHQDDGAEVAPPDDPLDEAGGRGQAQSEPLVTRVTHPRFPSSQLIVITNGSFFLNLPLVNHEHRKLAGRLVAECGDPAKVVLWEGLVFAAAADNEQPDEWSFLKTWPINFILLHLAVLGFLYMLWRFPIFGPQRTLPASDTSDFGHHIEALGDLLDATRNARDARERVAAYQEIAKRE